MEFKICVTYNDGMIEVKSFNSEIERSVFKVMIEAQGFKTTVI